MRTSYSVILFAMLLVEIASAQAAGKAAPHRYTIKGSLEAAQTRASSDGVSTRLGARLSAPVKDVGLQSGGDFVVMAKLADSTLGCSGDDTIFVNGFDLSG